MPTPIGHALAGVAVAFASRPRRPLPHKYVALLIFCATAPDLDLLLVFFDGVNHHRGASHSLGAALLAGLVGYALSRRAADRPSAFIVSAAWGSHVLLDFLGVDTSPPAGEMALWPWSDSFYISPIAVFYDVRRSFSVAAIQHNAIAVAIESIVLVPIVIFCRGRLQPRRPDLN